MSKIDLSKDLPELTPDLFTTASAIVGIRGSGKTSTGVVVAEQAIGHGVPPVIVDPTGVWFGLKSSADGKKPGLPVYVFGGEHADVPLDPAAGAIIARFVVDERVPVILDVSDLTKGKQHRFVGQFFEALYDLKNRKRDPLLVIIDEAPRFIPQQTRGSDVDLNRCIGAVEDIVALGRSRGLGCALIGQRPATINKNVLTQCDNLFAMRTVGTQDRKAIDEWVTEAQGDQKQRDELVSNLASLAQGDGYFWSPATFGIFRRVHFSARTTFDSSRTPKVGEQRIEPTAFAKVDLDKLRGEIAEATEKAKADDPKALRAEIAQLRAELATRAPETVVETVTERVEVPVSIRSEITDLQLTLGAIDVAGIVAAIAAIGAKLDRVLASENDGTAPGEPAQGVAPDGDSAKRGGTRRRRESAPTGRPRVEATALPWSHPSSGAGDVGGGPRKILAALAATKDRAATRTQLAFLAGFSHGGGSYARYLTTLRAAHAIVDQDGRIYSTAAGEAILGPDAAAPAATTRDVLAMFRSKLGGGPRKMFDALVEVWPGGLTRDALATATGYEASGGSFARYLTSLSSAQLIERRSGTIRLVDELFPTGKVKR